MLLIPVRVPAAFEPYVTRDDCTVTPDHPLYGQGCPVCGGQLGNTNLDDGSPIPVALVAVGVAPDDRKPAGWTTGAAVAVHTACARPAGPTPVVPEDISPQLRDLAEAAYDSETAWACRPGQMAYALAAVFTHLGIPATAVQGVTDGG
jgi:hypothetical protein